MHFEDLIYVMRNQLDKDFCKHCIEKFNNDDNQKQGAVGKGIDLDIKQSMDLYISQLDHWKEEDNIFFKSLSKNLDEYRDWAPEPYGLYSQDYSSEDTGYQIQKTVPGGFYVWHQDQLGTRFLTFIWYLNDVHEDGYTEFKTGLKIQPEAGKIVIFPSSWPWIHRGYPPKSEDKYICTGWIRKIPGKEDGLLKE